MIVTALRHEHCTESLEHRNASGRLLYEETLPGFPLFAMAARISVAYQGWPQEGTGKPFIY